MRRFLLALSFVLMPAFALAQVALVADRVYIRDDKTLVAEGNVEVYQDGTRIRATRIEYNERRNNLKIQGPLTIDDGRGSVLIAEEADIDDNLRRGILKGARLVLDQQLQIAANEIGLVDDRYRTMSKVVASTCRVCATSQRPLWEIRAEQVIHDSLEQQLYLKGAQFRVAGVPLAYVPHMRVPGPEVKRQSGLLTPTFISSTDLGVGFQAPYFQTLGESADVTITPLLTTDSRTLSFVYRQGFENGHLKIDGAVSDDDIRPGDVRSYLFVEGSYAAPGGFNLSFDLKSASDDDYLDDYGFYGPNQLISTIEAERTDRDSYTLASIANYNALNKNGFDEDILPDNMVEFTHDHRFDVLGGEANLTLDYYGLTRPSTDGTDTDADGIGDGRDTSRIGISAGWRGDTTLSNGMVLAAGAGVTADIYDIDQDDNFTETSPTRVIPHGMVELRWPHTRMDASGGYQTLEPVAQLVWSEIDGDDAVPDETSTMVDFDEGNLFSTNRYSGYDMVEEGLRANLGVTWTRYDPDGWSSSLAVGRVLRFDEEDQFDEETGLRGEQSDWLVAGAVSMGSNVSLANRAIFDDEFDFTSNETHLNIKGNDAKLTAAYIWAEAEPAEDRPDDIHELSVNGSYRVNRHWTGRFDTRFDIAEERVAKLGLGLEYRNECVRVDFSVSNSYDNATTSDVDTKYGVELQLLGLGGGTSDARYARQCSVY